ncbi:hypothetical protein C8Q70DRAFT_928804, partial [Cubamyces menziesii]
EITLDSVRGFIFHPLRCSTAGKTRKEILKAELLRWHPDKFDTLMHPKIREVDWSRTKEAAGLVARWITHLMTER